MANPRPMPLGLRKRQKKIGTRQAHPKTLHTTRRCSEPPPILVGCAGICPAPDPYRGGQHDGRSHGIDGRFVWFVNFPFSPAPTQMAFLRLLLSRSALQ